jgi:25S rRNA (cytosine2278-C5)-methyltransferase
MKKRKPVSIVKRDRFSIVKQPIKKASHKRPVPSSVSVQSKHRENKELYPTDISLRQASQAVSRLLAADAARCNGASLKSLTLAPHVRNKRAVHAITVETLKYTQVLERLLKSARVSGLPLATALVLSRELLFGPGLQPDGPAERQMLHFAPQLREEYQRLLDEAGVADVASLLPQQDPLGVAVAQRPRTARVNELKMSVNDVLHWLKNPPALVTHSSSGTGSQSRRGTAKKWAHLGSIASIDPLVPEVLCFPPGTDLHDHPLVQQGVLILQSKASCLTARALAPKSGWKVLDACAAPGNKTTHLAALLHVAASGTAGCGSGSRASDKRKQSVIALDKDRSRLQRLEENLRRTGADALVKARCADFLSVDPNADEYCRIDGILLDPSCSGSGTAGSRMDHLLPSAAISTHSAGREADAGNGRRVDDDRVSRLAAFQTKALRHALRFPAVQRVAYSTCSVHVAENEGVVAAALEDARALGMELVPALRDWPRRGVVGALNEKEAAAVVRVDPVEDGTDGFFVAVFERVKKKG